MGEKRKGKKKKSDKDVLTDCYLFAGTRDEDADLVESDLESGLVESKMKIETQIFDEFLKNEGPEVPVESGAALWR